jgi:hypothetical protein
MKRSAIVLAFLLLAALGALAQSVVRIPGPGGLVSAGSGTTCTAPCIQSAGNSGYSATGLALTITSSGSGHFLVLNMLEDVATTISLPTDNQSSTWVQVFNTTCGNGSRPCAQFMLYNSAAGITTITTHTTGGTEVVVVAEFSGVITTNPLDQTGAMSGVTSTPYTSPSVTTTSAHELLIGYMGSPIGGSTNTYTGTGGWIVCAYKGLASYDEVVMAYQVVTSTGTYANTGTFTGGGSNTFTQISSFKNP